MTDAIFTPACKPNRSDFIALFPAAGHAHRLAGVNASVDQQQRGSKELLAVPDLEGEGVIAVGDYLMREFHHAGIREVVIITRPEKTDIAEHYGQMEKHCKELSLRHLITESTPSTAHTIDKAWELFRHRPVAFGFPDIIVHPPGVFDRLCDSLIDHNSDVCLGLFPATNPTQSDMVAYHDNALERIEIKPAQTNLNMTWSCAVWKPTFSQFLHQQIALHTGGEELFIGQLFDAARKSGMSVAVVPFPAGFSLDIGTPETLNQALSLSTPSTRG